MRCYFVLFETSSNQRFLFQTNKRRENVGASQLTYQAGTAYVLTAVGRILATEGAKFEGFGLDKIERYNDPEGLRKMLRQQGPPQAPTAEQPVTVILATSGKALLLVHSRELGQQLVKHVTALVLHQAPGLDLSGVVGGEFTWDVQDPDLAETVHRAVKRVHELLTEIRSFRSPPGARFPRLPVVSPCSSSGTAASREVREGDSTRLVSRISHEKREAANQWLNRIKTILGNTYTKRLPKPEQLEELFGSWVAVVHADGNGVGKIFLNFKECLDRCPDLPGEGDPATRYLNALKNFSLELEEATERAFCRAVAVLDTRRVDRQARLPLLPLVLGGDDLTVLCDGAQSLEFARQYLIAFEEETASPKVPFLSTIANAALGTKHLTACAGVAIVKNHFPFSSAYDLAEDLLRKAKTVKQEPSLPTSALDFHILYDASLTDLADIRQRLTRRDEQQRVYYLFARPYVVTQPSEDHSDWVKAHYWQHLADRITAIRRPDSEQRGNRALPNGQLHHLREGLFHGPDEADARLDLIYHRYEEQGLEELLESPSARDGRRSLFRSYLKTHEEVEAERAVKAANPTANSSDKDEVYWETRFLDALEASEFWDPDRTSPPTES